MSGGINIKIGSKDNEKNRELNTIQPSSTVVVSYTLAQSFLATTWKEISSNSINSAAAY